MVIVRESPKAHPSPDRKTEQWPPRSPFQALLSSPSGRKRWQDRRAHSNNREVEEERSPSPSPMRKPMASHQALQASFGMSEDGNRGEEEEEQEQDEDEETLQLQLKAIEAKLKLKKLQQKNKSVDGSSEAPQSSSRTTSRSETARTSPRKILASAPSLRPPERDRVEVPVSPSKDRIIRPQEQLSPARARLGLNAAARASDVSLKRSRDGTQLKKSETTRSGYGNRANVDTPKPKSFSQRLAEGRMDVKDQEEKNRRIRESRTKGFGLDTGSVQSQERETSPFTTAGSRRLAQEGNMPPPSTTRSRTAMQHRQDEKPLQTTSESSSRPVNRSPTRQTKPMEPSSLKPRFRQPNPSGDSNMDLDEPPAPKPQHTSFDPFSQLHLSTRHIPHTDIARALEGKEIYPLPRLLKEVVAPTYEPPDCETDFVVLAVLASKSSPFNQKPVHLTSETNKPQYDADAPRNKFMVLKLTDLKWELDLFLFGTAFDQFWKLTPGTLLAILNPSILPPKKNSEYHSGRFSLKLGSSEDSVMEIGLARDLAWCKSVKKNGESCGDWVDKTRNDLCAFHVEMLVERSRKSRMQVNTMNRGAGGGSGPKSRGRNANGPTAQPRSDAGTYRREYGQVYNVPGSGRGNSAASLLDADDIDKLHNMTTEEASRKRIAAAQKERDTARRLGAMGSGMGAEYLRAKHDPEANATAQERENARNMFDKPKIADLGLLGKSASAQRLSPAKDRKRHFGTGDLVGRAVGGRRGEAALGWGGARKAGLLLPKGGAGMGSPEKGLQRMDAGLPSAMRPQSKEGSDGSLSPRKKRARYEIAGKGIREPGRESLGEELRVGAALALGGDGDDDDDGLDIV